MGNQHSSSAARQSTSPPSPSYPGQHSPSPPSQQQSGSSKPDSSHSSKSSRTRGSSQSHHRFFHPFSGSHSDTSTYDYTLTPSTSLSPSLTRIETQHHYNHKHGSSLDSYIAGEQRQQEAQAQAQQQQQQQQRQSGSDFDFTPSAPIDMGAASSSEKLPKRQPSTRVETGSPHSSPLGLPSRTRSTRQRGSREGTPGNDSPGFPKPSGTPSSESSSSHQQQQQQQQQYAQRERDSVSSVSSSYAGAQPMFTHPPRLPLPIQEEELAPGSPVLGATTAVEPEDDMLPSGLLQSRSVLSTQTGDDEDEESEQLSPGREGSIIDDTDEGGHPQEAETGSGANRRRTVPTEVIWRGRAEKIYVTGTFANWSKKFRMNYDPHTQIAVVTLDLVPGTHHVRFIADGEMHLSRDLPTAVDYTNTLVNYIEVSADAAYTQRPQDHSAGQTAGASVQPDDVHPPLVRPQSDATTGQSHGAAGSQAAATTHSSAPRGGAGDSSVGGGGMAPSSETTKAGPELMDITPCHYGQVIPGYLSDLDRDEKSARFARASARVAEMALPPTLPGFLVRSVLNMATPTKDDTSVLNMPNHTMLNHLATSSIRQGVLATSLTTRYKRKYVTLITYRPTSMDD